MTVGNEINVVVIKATNYGDKNVKIGDLRIIEFIHPDSMNVTVWEVEQLTLATGKYAKEGQTYWENITPSIEPFTDKKEAELFMTKAV
jgi:hypothetical protein